MGKLFYLLAALFGMFLFVYGGYDDSPGAQGLGILLVGGGCFGFVRGGKRQT